MAYRCLRAALVQSFLLIRRATDAPGKFLRKRELARAMMSNKVLTANFGEIMSRMHVDGHSYLANVYVNGSYEPRLIRFLKRTIKGGWTCIDVGANVGYISLLMGQLVEPAGRVVAFEPTPSTYEELLANIRLNERYNIKAERLALGERCGPLKFHVGPRGFEVYNSAGIVSHPSARTKVFERITVQCETLDSYCEGRELNKVDLVKIDVEGGELSVLRGMENTLKANPNMILVLELADQTTKGFGYEAREIATWLSGRGWRLFLLNFCGRTELVRYINQRWCGQLVVARKAEDVGRLE
jgi:FkbM family methyltransferase